MMPSEMLKEIQEVFARCQRSCPTIQLPFESFCDRLAEIRGALHEQHAAVPGQDGPAGNAETCTGCIALTRQLHHEDLYLAIACARGDRIAWEYFADQYLPQLKRFAIHACRNLEASEDLAQEMIVALLGESSPAARVNLTPAQLESGLEGNKGKLQSYNGRGSLSGWLRAAVSHAAIDRFRRTRKQVSLEELSERGDLPQAQNPDPMNSSEEGLDSRWGAVLVQSVKQEIARLSARDRLLLSLYHLEGVSLKLLGLRYGVHEATVSRWLEHARQDVRKGVERELRKVHGLSAREVGFLWHWALETANPMLDSVLQPALGRCSGSKEAARQDNMIVTHKGEL